jgi:hypothetical protein
MTILANTHQASMSALVPAGPATAERDDSALLAAAEEHLHTAFALLRTLSEQPDPDRTALWWTARQSSQAALEVVSAARLPAGLARRDQLQDALGTARGAVESGKMAIYAITGSRHYS